MTELVGFDSNVLIYAFNPDEKQKHDAALALLENVNAGVIRGFASLQSINELFFVLARKKKLSETDAEKIGLSFLDSEKWIIAPLTSEVSRFAFTITSEHKNHFWDSLILANMVIHGVKKIYTENAADFPTGFVDVVNPFT